MYIYIANILLSTIFFKLSDYFRSRICLTIAVLLPVSVAGLRDTWIGTDIAVYAADTYSHAASSSSFFALLSQFSNQPPGFLLLTWIVSRLGQNLFWVYLATLQLICIIPIYITLKYLVGKYTWLGMCAYLILIFPSSLNMMKQCIAVCIVFSSLIFIKKRNFKLFLLTILLAFTMHQTAILFIVIYPLYLYIGSQKIDKVIKYLSLGALTFIFIFSLIIYYREFITILADTRDTYTYIADRMNSNTFNQTNLLILLYMIILHLFFIREGNYKKNNITGLFFTAEYLSILGWCAEFLSLIAAGLSRIGLYGQIFNCLYLVLLAKILPKRTAIILQSIYVILALYTSFHLIINGQNQIYPYSSRLLGI
ncbi:EpsG family protein [Bifidobacterium felsineum]|uniref:EpsG family protein n=1 Tax=Bifidobacterium felsineum TaxID=2045440 RepID=A0A2M9HHT7_9BIFI|nr:hypothetical protein CSQ86_09610 [Bifidobacterium felsineum]